MEFDFSVGISIIYGLINIIGIKPHPVSIGDEYLYIRIPLSKRFKGVPAFMTVSCRDIPVKDL